MAESTRRLHDGIDDAMRRKGEAFLHPDGETIQLDLFGSQVIVDWQEAKSRLTFLAEGCWSQLPQTYARYGTQAGRALLDKVRELEAATSAVVTDCGMQACALLFDVLFERGSEVLVARTTYNKTKAYLNRLAERMEGTLRLVDDDSLSDIGRFLTERTRFVFVETYSNPLTRAVDLDALREAAGRARANNPRLRVIVDNTVATPWGVRAPVLSQGVDFVVASGTKALDGRDQNMWGYIASNRVREMNEVMDLQAMRGGILDWRRARAILSDLDAARLRFVSRSASATEIAEFLSQHPGVSEVFHPSLAEHPDAHAIARQYLLHGSLLSFRLRGADEDTTRRFCDVLAMTGIVRYALSFDGLATKVNHHRLVSEYHATDAQARALGVDRLVRLGVGLEDVRDLIACLAWALRSFDDINEQDIRRWQERRREELGLADVDDKVGVS
jgi:cystathionine beta-lyase/cystathionine gamma-synthase